MYFCRRRPRLRRRHSRGGPCPSIRRIRRRRRRRGRGRRRPLSLSRRRRDGLRRRGAGADPRGKVRAESLFTRNTISLNSRLN